MRPYRLARPRSRFTRPHLSWMRRLARATRLRAGVGVVLLLVVILPLFGLFGLARRHGWFYSTGARVQLWGRLPDQAALERLKAIYAQDPNMTKALAYIESPYKADVRAQPDRDLSPLLPQLLSIAAERQLRELDRQWSQPGYDSLCDLVGEGRRLSHPVVAHFKAFKLARAGLLAERQPADESETVALVQELQSLLRGGPVLFYQDLSELRQQCETTRDELIRAVDSASASGARLPALRRLQILLRLARLRESESLSRRWGQGALAAYFQHVQAGDPESVNDLLVLAHCRILWQWLDLSALQGRLSGPDLDLLSALDGLSRPGMRRGGRR